MVFDKKGHFVDGLKAEQFALKVDNRPQTVSFFLLYDFGFGTDCPEPGADRQRRRLPFVPGFSALRLRYYLELSWCPRRRRRSVRQPLYPK